MKPSTSRKKNARSSFASTTGGFVATAVAPAERAGASRESVGKTKR